MDSESERQGMGKYLITEDQVFQYEVLGKSEEMDLEDPNLRADGFFGSDVIELSDDVAEDAMRISEEWDRIQELIRVAQHESLASKVSRTNQKNGPPGD